MASISTVYMYLYGIIEDSGLRRRVIEPRYPRLVKVMEHYIYERKTCPFCKKTFKTISNLKTHLRKGDCGVAFRGIIELMRRRAPEEEVLKLLPQ